jgi:hypothetical protein
LVAGVPATFETLTLANFVRFEGDQLRRGVLATFLALNQKKLDRYEPPKVTEAWTLARQAVLKTVAVRAVAGSIPAASALIPWLSGKSGCFTSRQSVVRVHPGSLMPA